MCLKTLLSPFFSDWKPLKAFLGFFWNVFLPWLVVAVYESVKDSISKYMDNKNAPIIDKNINIRVTLSGLVDYNRFSVVSVII